MAVLRTNFTNKPYSEKRFRSRMLERLGSSKKPAQDPQTRVQFREAEFHRILGFGGGRQPGSFSLRFGFSNGRRGPLEIEFRIKTLDHEPNDGRTVGDAWRSPDQVALWKDDDKGTAKET